jgi:hypothetical protein
MTKNDRKMNNYSLMRISTVFVLTFALVASACLIPFMPRTGAEPIENTPPYVPSDPDPADGSTDVPILAKLSWVGGDPDEEDTVVYDVYFGTTSPPDLIAENHNDTTYDPGLMNYSTLYYWKIIAWDDHNASTEGPEWGFTTEAQPNSPPYVPSNESPKNGSTGVALDVTLSWEGGDPDEEDTVVYDVYFGNSSDPVLVSNNQSETNYTHPELLENDTDYYWRVVAWDNHNESTAGPLWMFSTRKDMMFTVNITKPLENRFYFNDAEVLNLNRDSIVYGAITITAEVVSSVNISYVLFYVDGKVIGNVTQAPYEVPWRPIIQFNGLSLTRTIKVVAVDEEGNEAVDEINITKWRFHILPWLLVGAALASRLVLHTKVTGFFYNFKESRISVSFYAIHARYKTIGPFKTQRGVVGFKKCSGGFLIGPMSLSRFGPLHRFSYGTFTFIGNLHVDKLGLGQAIFSRILQPRGGSSVGKLGNLLNIVRAFRS